MRIIEEENNKIKTIILEDGDTLEISTLKKNKEKVIVKCIDRTLHVDELSTNQIKNMKEEEIAIRTMKNYLSENKEN